jgi:hypothetical protein
MKVRAICCSVSAEQNSRRSSSAGSTRISRQRASLRAISGSESQGGERQNPSKRLVMPVDVEHGRLMLVDARGDQQVWDRYAMLTVGRELTLSSQRGRNRLGVHPELIERVKLDRAPRRHRPSGRCRALVIAHTHGSACASLMSRPRTSADLSDSSQRRSRDPVSSTPRRRATDRRQPPTGSAQAPEQPGRADHEQPSQAQHWQARDVLPPRAGAGAVCGQRHPATDAPPRPAAPRDAPCPSPCIELSSLAPKEV